MRGLGVKAMVFAGGPDFVEQEGAGDVEGAVQVVGKAAVFAARGGQERAEFSFEEAFLAFLGAENDDEGYGVFGELGARAGPRLASRCGLLCFALRHGGGDCTPLGRKEKAGRTRRQDCPASKRWRATALQIERSSRAGAHYFSASLRPASRLSKLR